MLKKYSLVFISFLVIFQSLSLFFEQYFSNSIYLNNKLFFGLLLNNNWSFLISLIFLLVLFYLIKDIKKLYLIYTIIFAATLSNILDRLLYGGVVDFINIKIIPIFNAADLVIVVCLLLIFYRVLLGDEKNTS